jgi:16S rRNA (cytosine967-C5)-methyltransferase
MKSNGSSRAVALEVLLRVDGGAPSDRALDRALRRSGLDERDRRFTTEIVYGTLRRRATLDRLLAPHSRRSLDDLDPAVLVALRLAVYQCRFLDSVPDHAAVDAAVESIKLRRPAAAGFVNGVLRAWLRSPKNSEGADVLGDPPKQVGGADLPPAARLAVSYDIPEWWASRWERTCGEVTAAKWLARTLEASPLVLRPHTRMKSIDEVQAGLAAEGVGTVPATHATGALRVEAGNPLATSLFNDGVFALRGEASQIVPHLLHAEAGERILDACTGRGGKAIQCAEDFAEISLLAADLHPWRAQACLRAARQAGTPEVQAIAADLSRPLPIRAPFDRILLDAPCSGLGTVRRRPEVKWRVHEPDLQRLAELQRSILHHCADALADDGMLLYVTCSTEREENEGVVEAVISARPDLQRVPVKVAPGLDPSLVGEDGYFRTYPLFPDLEGFFAAAIQRRG